MRNDAAVLIRKEGHVIGVGLLETALAREGAKGRSPVLCTEPVALEPPYARFDADHVLTLHPPEPPLMRPVRERWVTLDVYPAEEDLLSVTWMETALRALGVLTRTGTPVHCRWRSMGSHGGGARCSTRSPTRSGSVRSPTTWTTCTTSTLTSSVRMTTGVLSRAFYPRFGPILRRFGHEVDEDTFAWNTRAALDYHRQILERINGMAKKSSPAFSFL